MTFRSDRVPHFSLAIAAAMVASLTLVAQTPAPGQGAGLMTAIAFRPVRARFVRITQTETVSDGPPWTMQRLRLYRAPAKPAATATR